MDSAVLPGAWPPWRPLTTKNLSTLRMPWLTELIVYLHFSSRIFLSSVLFLFCDTVLFGVVLCYTLGGNAKPRPLLLLRSVWRRQTLVRHQLDTRNDKLAATKQYPSPFESSILSFIMLMISILGSIIGDMRGLGAKVPWLVAKIKVPLPNEVTCDLR